MVKARGPVTNCLLSESVSFMWTSHKSERGADYSTRHRDGLLLYGLSLGREGYNLVRVLYSSAKKDTV
jgi:hypothetical protein